MYLYVIPIVECNCSVIVECFIFSIKLLLCVDNQKEVLNKIPILFYPLQPLRLIIHSLIL